MEVASVFVFGKTGQADQLAGQHDHISTESTAKYHVLAVAMRKEVEHMLHNWKIIIFYFIVSFNPAIQSPLT